MKTMLQRRLPIANCGMRVMLANRNSVQSIRKAKGENRNRHGAVAVEFAIVAPVLLTIVFGMIQYGRAFEMQNELQVAAREGARFASMDHTGMLTNGQTSNQKVAQDVKNFLATYGIDANDVSVQVKDHASPTSDFNLDDPNNNLKLFDVTVSVNYSKLSLQPVSPSSDYALSATVTFRNGQATISQ
jgi:Flp pilus assembly protein TadG